METTRLPAQYCSICDVRCDIGSSTRRDRCSAFGNSGCAAMSGQTNAPPARTAATIRQKKKDERTLTRAPPALRSDCCSFAEVRGTLDGEQYTELWINANLLSVQFHYLRMSNSPRPLKNVRRCRLCREIECNRFPDRRSRAHETLPTIEKCSENA